MKSPEGTNYPVLVAFACILVQAQQAGEKKNGKLRREVQKVEHANYSRVKTKQNSDSGNNTVCVLGMLCIWGWLLGGYSWLVILGRGSVYLWPSLRLRGGVLITGRLRPEVDMDKCRSRWGARLPPRQPRRAGGAGQPCCGPVACLCGTRSLSVELEV